MHVFYFTATWCQPCKVFGPIMDKASDIIPVEKVDIEAYGASELTGHYGILSVPTVIIIDENDAEVDRRIGAQTEQSLREWLESYK